VLVGGNFWTGRAENPRQSRVSPPPFRTTTPGGLTGLALPERTLEQIEDRLVIDAYQTRHHAVVSGLEPASRPSYATGARVPEAVRVVRAALSPDVAAFRQANQIHFLPPRGFRAPILENAAESWVPRLPEASLSAAEREASQIVAQRLAADGLLRTLARLIYVLGPENCLTNVPATHQRLLSLGYPADLLHHYRLNETTAPGERPLVLIETVARRLIGAAHVDPEAALAEPLPVVFDFQPSAPGLSWINRVRTNVRAPEGHRAEGVIDLGGRYTLATESGEHEIGLIRMQVGGGWRDGIIPGGSIDVVAQMVNYFRSADFLISVSTEASSSLQSLATNTWRLRRRNQVTVCEEAVEPSAWAQDNGKAGTIRGATGLPARPATLAPRYACMDEGKSVYLPAESYLADGLRAAGHPIIHSPLIFQGGNILGVREARTGRRVLVTSQGTIHRNLALGLSRAEVLAALKGEFGVDDCLVLPVLSYHLDFDVTFRNTGDELIAFVNDTPEAARRILGLGLEALARHGVLQTGVVERLKGDLAARRDQNVVNELATVLEARRASTNAWPERLARVFVQDPADDGAGNFQVFLLAFDLLDSGLKPLESAADSPRLPYLNALRRMEDARQKQIAALRQLGCRIVPVPSMQDLYRSINYLNGVQHRGGYVMPAYGGFYTPLDQAAADVFRTALGPDQHITLIQSAECQRLHGAVHCTASVYPRL
jgi:hypothetical protein